MTNFFDYLIYLRFTFLKKHSTYFFLKQIFLQDIPNLDLHYFKTLFYSKKQNHLLSDLLTFLFLYKQNFIYDVTEFEISQVGVGLKYFDQKHIFKLIHLLINLHILQDSPNNKLKTFNKHSKHSKTYFGFKNNMNTFFNLCNQNNIQPKIFSTDTNFFDLITDKDFSYNFSDFKINSDLHIRFSKNLPDDVIFNITLKNLYKNYPNLQFFQHLISDFNYFFYFDKPELQLTFSPNITIKTKKNKHETYKYIDSIGLRYTCSFCSYPKSRLNYDDKGREIEVFPNRFDYLVSNGFYINHDVKSSVPRVAFLLKTGEWLDENIDLYKVIYDKFKPLFHDGGDWNPTTRDAIKETFVECYFNKSPGKCYSSFVNQANVSLKKHTDSLQNITFSEEKESVEEQILALSNFLKSKDIKDSLRNYYYKFFQVINDNFYCCGSEIFYWESIIYIKVLKELLDNGYQVATCYDCFYVKKNGVTQQEFDLYVSNLIKKKALEVYKNIFSQ